MSKIKIIFISKIQYSEYRKPSRLNYLEKKSYSQLAAYSA